MSPIERAYRDIARAFADGRITARDVDDIAAPLAGIIAPARGPALGAPSDRRRDDRRRRDAAARSNALFLMLMHTASDGQQRSTPLPIVPRVQTSNQTGGFDSMKNYLVEPFYVDVLGTFLEAEDMTVTDATDPDLGAAAYLDGSYTDGEIELTTTAATAGSAVYARFAPDALLGHGGYQAVWEGTAIRVYRWDAGVGPTLLTTHLTSLSAGESFGLRLTGSTIDVLKNSAVVKTIADATYTSGKYGHGGQVAGTAFSGLRWDLTIAP